MAVRPKQENRPRKRLQCEEGLSHSPARSLPGDVNLGAVIAEFRQRDRASGERRLEPVSHWRIGRSGRVLGAEIGQKAQEELPEGELIAGTARGELEAPVPGRDRGKLDAVIAQIDREIGNRAREEPGPSWRIRADLV